MLGQPVERQTINLKLAGSILVQDISEHKNISMFTMTRSLLLTPKGWGNGHVVSLMTPMLKDHVSYRFFLEVFT